MFSSITWFDLVRAGGLWNTKKLLLKYYIWLRVNQRVAIPLSYPFIKSRVVCSSITHRCCRRLSMPPGLVRAPSNSLLLSFFFILALCLPELCLLLCAWLGEPRGEAKDTGWEQRRQHPFSSRSWALGWHESRWVLPERGACFYPPVVCFGCRLGHDMISRNHTYCWVIDEGSLPPNVVRQRLGPFSPFLWRRRRG